MLRIAKALVSTATALLVVAGCGSENEDGTVLVLAAASLTDAFTVMESEFEAANPDTDVEVSFGASSTLRVQIEQGAPADVAALASDAPMDAMEAAGLVELPVRFATNSMVLAIPADNPGGVERLADLAEPGLLVGVCAPQVPCGQYARELLEEAGVEASVDTEEPNVRALAAKLSSRELDAGLVYATDVSAMPDRLATVPLPDGVDVRAGYPIAVVAKTDARDGAERFIDFVTSSRGQAILDSTGFGGS